MARISVCITHYNRPEKLGATLASLAAQTRQPDEIFLWDDCSPNDPTPVVREWHGRFRHFVYHRNETNLGMPGNLNAVISQATGDYIANLHDADIYHPTLLEKWSAALDAHPTAGLVFCRDSRWKNPRFVRGWTPEPGAITPGLEFFERFYLGRIDSIIWGTVMARRASYQRLLPFDPQFKNWADVDMWMRFCGVGSIVHLSEQLIELDRTVTPLRRFSFKRARLVQSIILTNINRFYSGDSLASRASSQRRKWRKMWWRWMLGGIANQDWNRLVDGVRTRRSTIL
jgi:glycosyltransferase involved in cell wall biosynthesis